MTSLITIGAGFIILVGLLRQWRKHKRGIPLTKRQTLIDAIFAVGGILYIIEFAKNNFLAVPPEIAPILTLLADRILLVLIIITLLLAVISRIHIPHLERLRSFLNKPIIAISKPPSDLHEPIEKLSMKGIRFYPSREELPPLKIFLSEAEHEIVVVGVTLQTFASPSLDLTRKLIKRGRTIRFLLLDPDSRFVSAIEEVLYGGKGYQEAITASLESLNQLKNDLSNAEKDRLDIRTYDCLPLYGLMASDPNTENAQIRIEQFLYDKDARARPSFLILKRESEDEFQKYWEGYLFLRRRSKPYPSQ
jgi:hypothetical protein